MAKKPTSKSINRRDIRAIAVDAACSSNPGPMEYRGVWVGSGKVLFKSKLYPMGTNNMGEFLAIVHAMALMEQQGVYYDIYTDSNTAMSWIRKKVCKSTLPRTPQTLELWQHVERALFWIQTHDLSHFNVIKWDTKLYGEIPADFGRKK